MKNPKNTNSNSITKATKRWGFLFMGGDLEQFKADFAPITVPSVLLTNTAEGLGFENLFSTQISFRPLCEAGTRFTEWCRFSWCPGRAWRKFAEQKRI